MWLVTFTPTPELAKRDINVNIVRGRLQEIGELIRAAPRVISAGGIAFDFVVASRADETTFAALQDDGLIFAPYCPRLPALSGNQRTPRHHATMIAPSNVVRVDLGRLDELMQQVGALVVSRGRLADQLAHLETLLPVAEWRALQETTLGLSASCAIYAPVCCACAWCRSAMCSRACSSWFATWPAICISRSHSTCAARIPKLINLWSSACSIR